MPVASDMMWRPYKTDAPPKGHRLLLKMIDSRNDISYALGYMGLENGELTFSAQESKSATEPSAWMLVPD